MIEVTAIFDIGKTNKKLLLFDGHGNVLKEILQQFDTTVDEDGFPCEDIAKITKWVKSQWKQLLRSEDYKVVAANFTAFGASFVHLGENNKPVAPLYDYLRPVHPAIVKKFYTAIRDKTGQNLNQFTQLTCSPKLGMLNSGFQLYWIKKSKPELWEKIECSLHLPQYLSFILTGKKVSDYTSIGCHTALWNFKKFQYSEWVKGDIAAKLVPITSENFVLVNRSKKDATPIKIGFGLHDSSSALIPYLYPSNNSFILISTGTWSIQLNPFNSSILTQGQLHKDCLCYMQSDGRQVKASRLLLGREHDFQVNRIAKHFTLDTEFHKELEFDEGIFWYVQTIKRNKFYPACMAGSGPVPKPQLSKWDVSIFRSANEAYHSLIIHLVSLLKISIQLIDVPRVKTFYVDGGFARNDIFMNALAYSLYQKKVVASYLPQSTAMGAFMHLHRLEGSKKIDLGPQFKVYDKSEEKNLVATSINE